MKEQFKFDSQKHFFVKKNQAPVQMLVDEEIILLQKFHLD